MENCQIWAIYGLRESEKKIGTLNKADTMKNLQDFEREKLN